MYILCVRCVRHNVTNATQNKPYAKHKRRHHLANGANFDTDSRADACLYAVLRSLTHATRSQALVKNGDVRCSICASAHT